ncbi:MAG: anti-sigma factor family protein, partial [Bryobacteraceae bacterium]
MACQFESHPSEERWEEYALGLLDEDDSAELEEHLLVCPQCQDKLAETDAFIYAMREAARRLRQQPPSRLRLLWARLERWAGTPALAWGLAAAAVVMLALLVPRYVLAPGADAQPALTVMLYAARGVDREVFAQAPAGRPLR